MEALKEAVERIVAPIPAEEYRKNIYREELYGHALERYREALQETDSPKEAVALARARLGEPASLRKAFLRELGLMDRIGAFVTHHSERRRGETLLHFAGRTMLLVLCVVVSPIFLLVTLTKNIPVDMVAGLYALGALVAWTTFTLQIVIAVSLRGVERINHHKRSRWSLHRMLLLVATASALVFAVLNAAAWFVLWFGMSLVYGADHASVVFLKTLSEMDVLYWSIAAGLAIVIPWGHLSDIRRRSDIEGWPYAH